MEVLTIRFPNNLPELLPLSAPGEVGPGMIERLVNLFHLKVDQEHSEGVKPLEPSSDDNDIVSVKRLADFPGRYPIPSVPLNGFCRCFAQDGFHVILRDHFINACASKESSNRNGHLLGIDVMGRCPESSLAWRIGNRQEKDPELRRGFR